MSSAASRPPYTASPSQNLSTGQSVSPNTNQTVSSVANSGASGSNDGLRKPPSRSLMQPPARPKPPKPAPAPPPKQEAPVEPEKPQRPGPISLPSEPMQYRAIGLIKGKYIASEEQFNRGDIQVEDGTLVDAVLLGRTTSLIKKHLDLEKAHLWVVYPRTLFKDVEENDDKSEDAEGEGSESKGAEDDTKASDTRSDDASEDKIPALHVQIVGVWEPETLNPEAMAEDEETRPLSSEEAEDLCDRFSIRGEIAKYSEEDREILVNIVQKSKSESVKPKRPFKLLVEGKLTGRTVGYFWDLSVERQDGKLILKEGKAIAVVPPKKKPKGKRGGGRRRPMGGSKPRGNAPAAPKPKPKAKTAEPAPAVEATAESTSAESAQE